MNKLKVTEIPVPKSSQHEQPRYDVLPKHEFTLGLIAPKGCGKTTMIVNLLEFYKGYFHSILIFSPTVASDEKWDYVKDRRYLSQNKKLQDFVQKMKGKSENSINEVVPYRTAGNEFDGLVNPYDESFDGKIPEECFFSEYTPHSLEKIANEQMTMVKLLKKYDKSKHLANRVLIIFDDLVGSALFGGERKNFFTGLNTRHRHYSFSMIMVSQGYKEIPKTIRTNWSALILFRIGNEKELEVIFEEYNLGYTRDQWMQAYNYCMQDEYGFMFINYQKTRAERLWKNFDEILNFK